MHYCNILLSFSRSRLPVDSTTGLKLTFKELLMQPAMQPDSNDQHI